MQKQEICLRLRCFVAKGNRYYAKMSLSCMFSTRQINELFEYTLRGINKTCMKNTGYERDIFAIYAYLQSLCKTCQLTNLIFKKKS